MGLQFGAFGFRLPKPVPSLLPFALTPRSKVDKILHPEYGNPKALQPWMIAPLNLSLTIVRTMKHSSGHLRIGGAVFVNVLILLPVPGLSNSSIWFWSQGLQGVEGLGCQQVQGLQCYGGRG